MDRAWPHKQQLWIKYKFFTWSLLLLLHTSYATPTNLHYCLTTSNMTTFFFKISIADKSIIFFLKKRTNFEEMQKRNQTLLLSHYLQHGHPLLQNHHCWQEHKKNKKIKNKFFLREWSRETKLHYSFTTSYTLEEGEKEWMTDYLFLFLLKKNIHYPFGWLGLKGFYPTTNKTWCNGIEWVL